MPYTNILLIDDDPDDQEIFQTALERTGHAAECTALDDAREALLRLEAQTITPDIIFLDLNMPVMSGQQFLTEIKKRDSLRDIPIIILSTSSHKATINLTLELGAHDFITKPDSFDALVTILRTVIN